MPTVSRVEETQPNSNPTLAHDEPVGSGVTAASHRFISVDSEWFKLLEAAARGGRCKQRGAGACADVRGASRVGEWNGCAAAASAAAAAAASRGYQRVTLAVRLLGLEMQHPSAQKEVTLLWCKQEVVCDVCAAAARPVCATPDTLLLQHVMAAICSLCRRK